jgi:hypothetical protein
MKFSMPKQETHHHRLHHPGRGGRKAANCALSAPRFCLNVWELRHEMVATAGAVHQPMVSALTLDNLQQRFTEQPVVRAHFDQTRTIKDLPQPLRSQGRC